MRILMLAPQPFFQPRGTPFSVLHRLRALSALGHEIDLVTYHLGEDVRIERVNICRIPRVPFVRSIAIGPSKSKIVLDVVLFFKALRLLRSQKYDVIHSHEEAGFFATFLARRFGLRHLYDMHSSLPQQLSNFKYSSSRFLRSLFERLEANTITRADAVITICPELHSYVGERFPDTYNILIENVGDNSLIFKQKGQVCDAVQAAKEQGQTLVLYTGTFEAYQGIGLLLDAAQRVAKEVRGLRFVLVGGKPEQVEHYRAEARRLGIEDRVTFTGSVPPEDVPAYIAAADMLVSPRVSGNNTPLKIYSYLRSGKPIVATRHITHTQVLNDEVAVLTGDDGASFAEGILRVIREPELRARICRNAQKLAEEKYSYDAFLSKTKAVFDYLAHAAPAEEEKECVASVA